MAAANLPIRFNELFQLTNLGIAPESIGFATVTLESEKFVCVRETVGGQNQVAIIEIENVSAVRFPIQADSAIMNPTERIIAVKAQQALQIYHLGEKRRLKAHNHPEPVLFWKWISSNTLGLVTQSAVYHWSVDGPAEPQKMFDRQPALRDYQIINYRADNNQKWLCLIGIAQQEGRIVGQIQLYSTEKRMSQVIEGHAAAFVRYQASESAPVTTLLTFASRTPAQSKLLILEVGEPSTGFPRKTIDIMWPSEAASDFPVALQASERYDLIYMITKLGFLYIWHIGTGTLLLSCRVTAETIFVSVPHAASGGFIGVNRKGQVLSVSIDPAKLLPYVTQTLNNMDLVRALAAKGGLPGAEEIFSAQFNRLFAIGDYKGAALVAFESPGNVLRTPSIMARFAALPTIPGQPPPLLQYFAVLLEKGKLNKAETVELARLLLQQGRHQVLDQWLQQNKLECSEEFGDLVRQVDANLALQIYFRAEVKNKVIALLAETGQFDKVIAYTKKVNFQPDWSFLLQRIISVNPQAALQFAQLLVNDPGIQLDAASIIDIFVQRNLVQETTSLILDVLKGEGGAPRNRPEDGPLQTRLLEINLLSGAPQVADAILGNKVFTHFDHPRIASLCEKAGLHHRALELYTDLNDIRRVLGVINPALLTGEFLIGFFSRLTPEDAMQCLRDLMKNRNNLQAVVQVAIKYSEALGEKNLISLFESFQSYEGLFLFLAHVHKFSNDPDVHFKYIEAATKVGQFKEVERVVRDTSTFDPAKVKDFLKESRLADPLPLIIVCDRFDFVADLTTYLYKNNMLKFVEAYVQKINPANTPTVVGTLLDLDCQEEYVRNLILSVRAQCPVDEVVEQLEKRNRLKLLLPWLEARAAEGSKEPGVHNALAKIYVDLNREPEKFLNTNPYYDSRVVGKYCESRDPYLAFVAYKRGNCSEELIDVTNREGLFKNQARYLVEKRDMALWERVLSNENQYRRSLIDQVALPESNSPEEVSVAVKAFMNANLPKELMELLEKIVLEQGTKFTGNRDLSNLLILTAIKADQSKVMEYVNRLENYDGADIANIAVGSGLFEEAFAIFKRFKLNPQAIQVLIDHIKDLERATEFADRVNEPEVYSRLAKAFSDQGNVKAAIEYFIKANDPNHYRDVISAAQKTDQYADLARYLQMCRKKVKEPIIDSELVYAYAKTNKLAELEEFINGSNVAQIQIVGDRCFEQGLYEAARLLFSNINNYARLAQTLLRLGQFAAAVDAAKKANSLRTWKEVNLACIDAGEFRLAQASGLNVIIHGDEVDELVRNYESRGHTEEIIGLIENGLNLERAHAGMFTELAILYSRYKPERLMEHLKLYYSRINIPKVMRTCERNQQWRELVFLQTHYDEYDNAALTMMAHPVDAWDHREFKEILQKVANTDVLYKAIQFYLEEHPLETKDLLIAIASKVDHTRTVQLVRRLGHLPLIKEYLQAVQAADVPAVNEALNQLYIEEADYEKLRESIDTYKNYDGTALAAQIERHELLEFRRIAAYLLKKEGRFAASIELSKQDRLYRDAIDTAADSKDPKVVEDLLRFFVDVGNSECFSATLYTCYDLVRPDVALELAWRAKMLDFAFPYLVQVVREYTSKVDSLIAEREKKKAELAQSPSSVEEAAPIYGSPTSFPPGVVPVAVPPAVVVSPTPGAVMVPPGVVPVTGFVPPPTYSSPSSGFGFVSQ